MDIENHDASWLALRRTAALVDSAVEGALAQYCDLRRDAYLALSWLRQGEAHKSSLSPRGLEKAVNLTPSGTSRLLARMESDGLITRSTSDTDRRAIEVLITQSGIDRLKRAQPFVAEAVRRVLGNNSVEELNLAAIAAADAQNNGADGQREQDEEYSVSGIVTWHTVDAVSVADACVVRQSIEPVVLTEAARYATDTAVVELTKSVVDMVRNTGNPEAFLAADSRFYATIAAQCQNRILKEIYLHILDVLESGVTSIDDDKELTEPYLAQRAKIHADLVDAISRHDVAAVEQAATSHKLSRMVDLATADAPRPKKANRSSR